MYPFIVVDILAYPIRVSNTFGGIPMLSYFNMKSGHLFYARFSKNTDQAKWLSLHFLIYSPFSGLQEAYHDFSSFFCTISVSPLLLPSLHLNLKLRFDSKDSVRAVG